MNTHWRASAACAGSDPDMFFAKARDLTMEARRVCSGCPVKQLCLDAAMAEEKASPAKIRAGIRGGLTPRQRNNLAVQRRGAPRITGGNPLAPCGTNAAYDRHLRNNEPVDEACRVAHNEKRRTDRAKRRAANRAPAPTL